MIKIMAELVLPAPIDLSIQYFFYGLGRGACTPGYRPRPRPQPCYPTTVLLAPLNVKGPDLAHNRTSQPQYCRFREI